MKSSALVDVETSIVASLQKRHGQRNRRLIIPDQVCVVVLLSLHQLRVSPLHEGVQGGPSWGGHRDQVPVGPDLQPHQSNESPEGLVGLRSQADPEHLPQRSNRSNEDNDSPG